LDAADPARAAFEAGRYEEALGLLARRGQDDPATCTNRALLLSRLGRKDEAMEAYRAVLARHPGHPGAAEGLALLLGEIGADGEALRVLQGALRRYPAPVLEARTAMPLLRLGRLREGFRAYAHRWTVPEYGDDRHATRRPDPATAWHGQYSVAGRRVLVFAEQGFGDTLQFVRFVPELARRGAQVLLEVQPELLELLRGFPGTTEVFAQEAAARGEPVPAFALSCPLLDLPGIFRTSLATLPRPVPPAVPPERLAAWRARLGEPGRPRVGLAWSGRVTPGDVRPVPPALLRPLLDLPVAFHAVQVGVSDEDRAALPGLVVHEGAIADFADAAALMSLLDAVVTIDTAAAHLAGTLGRPGLVMLAHVADWRWLTGRQDCPWYPSLGLLRQPAPGDWAPVVAQAGHALRRLFRL
jgi:hypothetical protein